MKVHMKKVLLIIVYVVFAVCLGILLCMLNRLSNGEDGKKDKIRPVIIRGQYSLDYGKNWTAFDKYSDIDTDSKSILIRGNVSEEIPEGDQVLLYLYRLDVSVRVNDELLLEEDANNLTHWVKFDSKGISQTDTVEIVMKRRSENAYEGSYRILLEHLQSGTSEGLLLHQIGNNLPKIILCVVTFLIGTATVFGMIGLVFLKVPELRGLSSCGFLMIVGAVCTFIDYEYITLIFHNAFMINVVDYVTQLLIVLFLIIYLKNYLKGDRHRFIVNICIGIWMAGILVCLALQLAGVFHQADMVGVMIGFALLFFGIESVFLLKDYQRYNEKRTKYVLFSAGILLIATAMEIVHYLVAHIFWIYVFQMGLIIFASIQYWVIISYSRERIRDARKKKEMEAELAQNRISIMLSQIQPHFLYNMLTVIYNLCGKDPLQAQNATSKFSDYLRGNLDSLHNSVPVTFAKELDHVKIYLELEKMRFGDELQVEYDIQCTTFMIPSLTIQPLIENAVKHGVGKKEDGGTVTIHTREAEDRYIVVIQDDGVGFDMSKKKNDGRSHIGMENVKNRLWSMSHATIDIKSEKGIGTTVTIEIPKEEVL